jgi:predicted nucleic acid-binding protein
MLSRGSREISLVDWSTIVVAQRVGATVFAFDSDFAKEGVATVPQ